MDDSWGVTGHDWAVNMLREHIARGTTRHAYLITGPRGVGCRTLGLRYAQALNCSNPSEAGTACDSCDECTRIRAGTHPDVMILEAEAEGGVLKVEQVRELRRVVALKPFHAHHRVIMLLRFQEANDAAANALLKTLEEAPAYAVLILTAESPDALLPTIVSRCEVLRLHPVQRASIQSLLEQRGADRERARLLAHISDGRPGVAIDLLGNTDALAVRTARLDDLQTLLPASRAERFAYAEKLGRDRPAMRLAVGIWLSFWRDVLWRVGGADVAIANVDRQPEIIAVAGCLDLARARSLVADHDRALKRLDANVNARLLAEVLLLDLPR